MKQINKLRIIYEKYRWIIDDENAKTHFTNFNGWTRKGILDEEKIIRIHNKDLRLAIKEALK